MSHPQSPQPTRIRQACVIPFHRQAKDVEFCLITSLRKRRWIFPKGIIEIGETGEETVLKEALEEAGLRGKVIGSPLGEYIDCKSFTGPTADKSGIMRVRKR